MFGTIMGAAAVDALMDGQSGKMVGIVNGKVALVPLESVVGKLKPIDPKLLKTYQQLDV
jgi:6-phosphofructokinase 1